MKNLITFLFVFIKVYAQAFTLPNVFGSGMVLQQNAKVKIWGWGKPMEQIKINTSWDNESYKATVPFSGDWAIEIHTPIHGGPYQILIDGINSVKLDNILIGEVWVVSGQSNMEWTASAGINDAATEISKAQFPQIRFFNVNQIAADYPQQNVAGAWQECTSASMKNFSAIGYFYAQKLHTTLDIPVGIINASWGGTPAETWTPVTYIQSDAILAKNSAAKKQEPWGPTLPGKLYNGMIAPLVGLKIKGFLWYQGESNVDFPYHYDRLLGTMIKAWRAAWKENLPFYYVQIAPFKYGTASSGVALRNAQRRLESQLDNTAMVVISDIGNVNDIHPKNKKEVGYRLANVCLKKLYGLHSTVDAGPKLLSYESRNDGMILYFDTSYLQCDADCRANFEIADISGEFKPATVRVNSNSIVLKNPKVSNPIFARFEWSNTQIATLKNSKGLPASAFVTDNWINFMAF